MFKTMTMV